MTLGCARCGRCCEPVVLDFDKWTEITQRARCAEELELGGNYAFIAQHWRPVSAWRNSKGATQIDLRCDMFDSGAWLCTAHDGRPPICRDYPWYGGDTEIGNRPQSLYRECSYLLDVPPADRPEGARPLIPLTVLGSP